MEGVTNLTTSPEIPSPQLTSTHCPAPAAAVTPQSLQPPLDLQTETTVPVSRSAEIFLKISRSAEKFQHRTRQKVLSYYIASKRI